MTVLVDLSILGTATRHWGIGRYVDSLARGFAYDRRGLRFLVDALAGEVTDDPLEARARLMTRSVGRYRWAYGLRVGLARAARRVGATVVHLPHVEATPLGLRARRVVTAHDLIPHTEPGYVGWRDGFGVGRRALDRRRYDADHVIAVSDVTARELRSVFGGAPVTVVPHGTDFAGHGPRVQARPYVLVVGNADPRKRPAWCLEALARTSEVDLIWAGGLAAARRQEVAQMAERLGLRARLQLWGRVTEPQLRRLYAGALALWMPSRAEGFGLPVLEAMACGAPVVVAPTPALLEVGGAAAAVARSPAEMAVRTMEDASARVAAGRARAAELSLRRQTAATRAVYEATRG